MGDAGDYSSTMHYLKAIEAAARTRPSSDEQDAANFDQRLLRQERADRKTTHVHDMYVYEVKKPSESKGEWDYYKLREVIPGDQAFRPLKDSVCRWSRGVTSGNPVATASPFAMRH